MEQLSIKTLVILCMSLFILASCGETSNNSITDAVTEIEVLETNIPFGNISQIVHPGILNNEASLDFIDADYNNNPYREQAYDLIDTMISSQISFPTSFPDKVFLRIGGDTIPDSELQMWNDGLLAYGHALRWAQTGNSTDASKAKTILNGWASAFDEGDIVMCKANDLPSAAAGCPTDPTKYPMSGVKRYLHASWVAPNFAAAAEIIRRYDAHGGAGWSSSDASNFEVFLERLYDPYVKEIADGIQQNEPRTGPPWGWSNNNWGASAVWAKMAIAAFKGETNRFNDALTKAGYLIENIVHSSTGEPTETNRDCLHPQMSLTALTYAAETAKIQGDHSLYGNFGGSNLKKGWEWMSDNYGTGACNTQPDDKIMPGVDVAYNYYRSNDIEDLHDQEEPYGVVTRQFIGFTTYTHYDLPQPATATTTAINQPTLTTHAGVIYPKSGGHRTDVSYNSGESIDNMLIKMRDAINSDQDAEITAKIDLSDDTITFIEKTPGSFANSNEVLIKKGALAWWNGFPFNPMTVGMSGGTN